MAQLPPSPPANDRGQRATLLACLGLVVAMTGAAYAAAPLYNMFCRLTGFDGTPIAREAAAGRVLERAVTVRFDTNVAPGLEWSFTPEVRQVATRLGETQTVFFQVKNVGRTTSKGVSTFNVQPGQTGAFFIKMKCFCFEEQTLAPGETMDFPVVFYIDPELDRDKSLEGLSVITLSYTYFTSRNGQPVASIDPGKPKL